jgi:magnesium transporter
VAISPTAPAAAAPKHWPASLYRRPDGALEQDLPPLRLREILERDEGELWVDIDSTDVHQHALLEKIFGFHPLAIEDTMSPGSRVKLEEYDRYIFVVMSGIRFDRATPDPFDLETFKLYFFLGKNFLVTVHAVESPSCDITRDRLARNPDLLGRGAEMTMHSIIDQAVDAYFPIVESLNDLVDQLEERLFEAFDEKLIHEISRRSAPRSGCGGTSGRCARCSTSSPTGRRSISAPRHSCTTGTSTTTPSASWSRWTRRATCWRACSRPTSPRRPIA